MSAIHCDQCGRVIHEGESALAFDVTRIKARGKRVTRIVETAYVCTDCEVAA